MSTEELSATLLEKLQGLLKLVKDPTVMSSLPQKTYDELSFSKYHNLAFDVKVPRTSSSDNSSNTEEQGLFGRERRQTDDILPTI